MLLHDVVKQHVNVSLIVEDKVCEPSRITRESVGSQGRLMFAGDFHIGLV